MKNYSRHSPDFLVDTLGLDHLRSLAIVGIGKNAGKTTVLNHILGVVRRMKHKRVVAVTSIGLDGEDEDIVTGGVKPRIYLSEGTLLVTACGTLSKADAVIELLTLTEIHTAAGEIVIGRTRTNGYVELAGPSIARDLATCERSCRVIEDDCLFIVDGALSRKSSAGGGLTESVILVAGAANASSLEELAAETARQVSFLSLPSLNVSAKKQFNNAIKEHPKHRVFFLEGSDVNASGSCEGKAEQQVDMQDLGNGPRSAPRVETCIPQCSVPREMAKRIRSLPLLSIIGEGKAIADELRKGDTVLLLRGAITDNVLAPLLSDSAFSDMTLVAEDGTRFFLSDKVMQQLRHRSIELAVLSELSLSLICVNPMRRDGSTVCREDILAAIESVVDVPVCELGPALV